MELPVHRGLKAVELIYFEENKKYRSFHFASGYFRVASIDAGGEKPFYKGYERRWKERRANRSNFGQIKRLRTSILTIHVAFYCLVGKVPLQAGKWLFLFVPDYLGLFDYGSFCEY